MTRLDLQKLIMILFEIKFNTNIKVICLKTYPINMFLIKDKLRHIGMDIDDDYPSCEK